MKIFKGKTIFQKLVLVMFFTWLCQVLLAFSFLSFIPASEYMPPLSYTFSAISKSKSYEDMREFYMDMQGTAGFYRFVKFIKQNAPDKGNYILISDDVISHFICEYFLYPHNKHRLQPGFSEDDFIELLKKEFITYIIIQNGEETIPEFVIKNPSYFKKIRYNDKTMIYIVSRSFK